MNEKPEKAKQPPWRPRIPQHNGTHNFAPPPSVRPPPPPPPPPPAEWWIRMNGGRPRGNE